jgi:hypothetical protein
VSSVAHDSRAQTFSQSNSDPQFRPGFRICLPSASSRPRRQRDAMDMDSSSMSLDNAWPSSFSLRKRYQYQHSSNISNHVIPNKSRNFFSLLKHCKLIINRRNHRCSMQAAEEKKRKELAQYQIAHRMKTPNAQSHKAMFTSICAILASQDVERQAPGKENGRERNRRLFQVPSIARSRQVCDDHDGR